MSLFFIASLCILNILLWIVFLVRFKRLFSTDDIISSAREEMNKMIADINRNTERDITLINDRIKELKAVIADADRHIAVAKSEKEKQEQTAAYSQKINEITRSASAQISPVQRAAAQYRRTAKTFDPAENAYVVTHEEKNKTEERTGIEQSLFDETTAEITVKSDGSSFAKVPVVGPEIIMAEKPIVPKKKFNEQVAELSEKGFTVEEIASELHSSITEVQFAIGLGA